MIANQAVDYSNWLHWLSLPSSIQKAVDVFYLYPSCYFKTARFQSNISQIDDPYMMRNAKAAFALQASVFETVGNIYAPYYRQTDPEYALSLSRADRAKMMESIPKSDVFVAFDYYYKHFNNGRPFILAAHSQGSNVMSYLLAEYMKEHPEIYAGMITAYVIGYSVTADFLAENPHLKFAEGADDTGVIISYNTEAPIVEGPNPVLLPGAISINPITWTREEDLARAEINLGSLVLSGTRKVVSLNAKNYADARVNKLRGVVICSTADVGELAPGNQLFGRGVFHFFDYSFYYYNIRENAAHRTAAYLKQVSKCKA